MWGYDVAQISQVQGLTTQIRTGVSLLCHGTSKHLAFELFLLSHALSSRNQSNGNCPGWANLAFFTPLAGGVASSQAAKSTLPECCAAPSTETVWLTPSRTTRTTHSQRSSFRRHSRSMNPPLPQTTPPEKPTMPMRPLYIVST